MKAFLEENKAFSVKFKITQETQFQKPVLRNWLFHTSNKRNAKKNVNLTSSFVICENLLPLLSLAKMALYPTCSLCVFTGSYSVVFQGSSCILFPLPSLVHQLAVVILQNSTPELRSPRSLFRPPAYPGSRSLPFFTVASSLDVTTLVSYMNGQIMDK